MNTERLEAFSDGVIAILITIMVLELKVPHEPTFAALREMTPIFLSYLLSFVFLAIYWNNHHHLFHATHRVNGAVLWANVHLLFWLSLVPFVTAWMGESGNATLPTVAYAVVLLCSAIAFTILTRAIISLEGKDSELARAIGRDRKGWVSLALYVVSIPLAYVNHLLADAIFAIVSLIWLVPDRRIEERLKSPS